VASPSKGEINRAGEHLADRLRAVRAGARSLLVDPDDGADVHAREIVEWCRDEHIQPMLEISDVVEARPDLPQQLYDRFRAAKPLLHMPLFADLDFE
jgi:hypothetical protein